MKLFNGDGCIEIEITKVNFAKLYCLPLMNTRQLFTRAFVRCNNFIQFSKYSLNIFFYLYGNVSVQRLQTHPMQVDIKMAADQKTNNLLSHLNEMRFNSPFSIDQNSCIKRLNKPFRE
ncbi:hypothetical protein T07_5101 [Trichinella nelsoni]|uniref:Uncharacterized protein n=1 Tax=Trichinella nelsoni TaxID=6336 RepID=A0A0V0RG90_9BILA|nr:hypothetical protein T07_5101 [Trichinella nelsoni]